ncbi:outer membrane beta-barrel protein [Candidatus Avelusimicrobium gallicola]|uniref:Outer membrane protein beta-barrel domain-containing protein n=1 Tax=Candidatus Avelusimicrobium gallicola TaxID=2562704 RepID=A0A1Y4DEL3_9BACT|nr:outer membrane beta-barrel protein [Elusimicrobium sp. An273]OUO57527.1 hypothetical protein B5F75_01775 [Elusimicrobium sp. An273]
MRKSVFAVCCLLAAGLLQAETIKMKTGELISGSILSQTEYTLNLATSYGNITLNQREIEQILPDKHRLILKGGTQLVGVILDLDEFNLKLQTDDGSIVNVDMPQIISIEVYDYDQGEKAQQKFVQENIQQQQAAAQAAAQQSAPADTVQAAGGLTFDSDINQVFDAQTATVVNGSVVTPSARVQTAAPKPMTDEEAFLKGVKTGAVSQQEYAAAAKEELTAKKPTAKKQTPKKTYKEKDFNKYFAVEAGAMALDLQASGVLKLGDLATVDLGDNTQDMGGTSAVISSKFLWRLKESNLWIGPMLTFASIANNDYSFSLPSLGSVSASSSGNILTVGAAANYYLNPAGRFSFYLTANAAYEMLTLNYRGNITTSSSTGTQELPFRDSLTSNGFSGALGLGVETWVDDVMIGLEVRQVFAPRSGELKESAVSNTVAQAKLSWKF